MFPAWEFGLKLAHLKGMKGSIATHDKACEEARRLLDSFAKADEEALLFQRQYITATMNGSPYACQLELLSDLASRKRTQEKSAYSRHTAQHGCGSARQPSISTQA